MILRWLFWCLLLSYFSSMVAWLSCHFMSQLIQSSRYYVGPLTDHTMYEAEAIGVILALDHLSWDRGITTTTICLDNQAILQEVGCTKSWLGQHLLLQICSTANCVAAPTNHWWTALTLVWILAWILGHDEIGSNEGADNKAKEAAKGNASQASSLPTFLTKSLLLCSYLLHINHLEQVCLTNGESDGRYLLSCWDPCPIAKIPSDPRLIPYCSPNSVLTILWDSNTTLT